MKKLQGSAHTIRLSYPQQYAICVGQVPDFVVCHGALTSEARSAEGGRVQRASEDCLLTIFTHIQVGLQGVSVYSQRCMVDDENVPVKIHL